MWQEYAIEPTALVRSLKEFNIFYSDLGWEHGRLLAAFPGSEYKRLVVEALAASPEQDIKKHTITNRLTELYEKALIAARRPHPSGASWVAKALAAHAVDPFHAVISLIASAGTTGLDDFDPAASPWSCCTDRIVPRTAQALAAAARKLFNHTSHVAIVDPHFAPHRPHVAPVLEAYLDSRDHTPGSPFRLSLHVGRQVMERGLNQAPFDNAEFETYVAGKISGMLRSGQIVSISIWDEIVGSERLHDRYILCRHGGLSIQGGADSGPASETTTLNRVSPATAREIIGRFEQSSAGAPGRVYDLVHHFEVK